MKEGSPIMSRHSNPCSGILRTIKRTLPLIMALALCGSVLSGCKTAEDDPEGVSGVQDSPPVGGNIVNDGNANTPDLPEPTLTDDVVTAQNIFEFVILGKYKGIEYVPLSVAAVTDQDVEEFIRLHLSQEEGLGDLTDDLVRELLGVDSVAEYRAIVREQLRINRETEADDDAKRQVWNVTVDNAAVLRFPVSEVEYRIRRSMMQFYYDSMKYGIELEDLIMEISGISLDEFTETVIQPGAFSDVKTDLVLRAIGAQEGITITEAELAAEVRRLVNEYGYESEEHFWELNAEYAVRVAVLSDKIIEFLMSQAIAK